MPIIGEDEQIDPLLEDLVDYSLDATENQILDSLLEGSLKDSDILQVVIQTKINSLESEFLSNLHPEAPWLAMLICNNYNLPIPDWARGHFAEIAERLFLKPRTKEEIAKHRNYGGHVLKVMGLTGKKVESIVSRVKGDIIASEVQLGGGKQVKVIENHKRTNRLFREIIANPKGTISSIERELQSQTSYARKREPFLISQLELARWIDKELETGILSKEKLLEQIGNRENQGLEETAVSRYCKQYEESLPKIQDLEHSVPDIIFKRGKRLEDQAE